MLNRRGLLLGAAALGMSGCKVLDGANDSGSLRSVFETAGGLTYRAQRLLAGDALAPEFTEADIRQGQRPNGSTNPDSPEYLALARGGFADYVLQVTGLVSSPERAGSSAAGDADTELRPVSRNDSPDGLKMKSVSLPVAEPPSSSSIKASGLT